MLELKNINVTLGRGSRLEKKILENLSLTINKGEFVVVIGQNGAGKSTLLRAISGDVALDSGKVYIEGKDLSSLPSFRRTRLIAQVLQDPKNASISSMTIEENLSFALMRGKSRSLVPHSTKSRKELFTQKLSLLGMSLEERLDELTSHLSGGQRQALSLIMAMMNDSNVLLLDEITSALDPKMSDVVMEITHNLVKHLQQTTLMITHHMPHALKYGDRTILLKEGKIFKSFTVEEKKNLTLKDLKSCFEKEEP